MSGESRTAITLIDTEGKENQIAREDIDELIRSRKSVMPEGFEKQMSAEELTSLLEFLPDKGKYMPVSLDRYATAISTKGLFSDGDNGPDRLVFSDWTPKIFKDVPFILTDPRGATVRNIILLYGPNRADQRRSHRRLHPQSRRARFRIRLHARRPAGSKSDREPEENRRSN